MLYIINSYSKSTLSIFLAYLLEIDFDNIDFELELLNSWVYFSLLKLLKITAILR